MPAPPRIVCDEREVPSGIPQLLIERGVRVDRAQIPTADYLLTWNTAVERKSVDDLVRSLFDGRLFEQCARLVDKFENAILLIEGDLQEVLYSKVSNPKAFCGAIASLSLDYKLRLLYSPSKEGTVCLLEALARRGTGGAVSHPTLTKTRKVRTPLEFQQLNIVASVPNVGPKLARTLLERFGSPRRVLAANVADLGKVRGIGFRRASQIVRILSQSFPKVDEHRKVQQSTFETIVEERATRVS